MAVANSAQFGHRLAQSSTSSIAHDAVVFTSVPSLAHSPRPIQMDGILVWCSSPHSVSCRDMVRAWLDRHVLRRLSCLNRLDMDVHFLVAFPSATVPKCLVAYTGR